MSLVVKIQLLLTLKAWGKVKLGWMVTISEDIGLGFPQKVDVKKSVIIAGLTIQTSAQLIVENQLKPCK
jgi:hypothetical protein